MSTTAVQDLLDRLAFRATYGRPCYIKRSTRHAALIVPQYTDGPTGSYSWIHTYNRSTVDDAINGGLIVLGADLVEVPVHDGPAGAWYRSTDHFGRTIRLAGDPA